MDRFHPLETLNPFQQRRSLLLGMGTGIGLSLTGLGLLATPYAAQAQAFDHQHAAWTALLKKHVHIR